MENLVSVLTEYKTTIDGLMTRLDIAGKVARLQAIEEQASAINPRDSIDDSLALADRFGLSLGFHAIDQDTYVAIVRTYVEDHGLPFDPAEAINWATRRGSRSGRVAWQCVQDLAGRLGVRIVG